MAKKVKRERVAPSSAPAAVGVPQGLKVKRQVTLPSLAIKAVNQTAVLQFDSAMRVSTVIEKKVEGKKPREPATIANVTEVTTGEQMIFIVPAVVKSTLERDYPKDSYVGCIFQITNKGKRSESQRYNDFAILELETE